MSVKLFVGNLPWSVNDQALEEMFAPYAEVESARIVTDRDTGRSRGFGFVELATDDATAVINAMNGREISGRPLRVNEAENQGRPSGGGGRGGFRNNNDRGPRRY